MQASTKLNMLLLRLRARIEVFTLLISDTPKEIVFAGHSPSEPSSSSAR